MLTKKQRKERQRQAQIAKENKGSRIRERRFVLEYLKDLNQRAAAKRAGFSSPEQSAEQIMKRPWVAAQIKEAARKRANEIGLEARMVLDTIARSAFFNIKDYLEVQVDGTLRFDFLTLTRQDASAFAEVQVEDFYEGNGKNRRKCQRVKIKCNDKLRALELLGKHLKLFTEVFDHGFSQPTHDALARALGIDRASDEVLDAIILGAKALPRKTRTQ